MKQPTFAKWSILPLVAACTACVHPATPQDTAPYRALGQEPGWSLTIANGRMDYQGSYGEKRIAVAAPEPRTTLNGHRYETPRLIVDITHWRCNDAMSGFGFADTVMVVADGETYRGCGGERRPGWDI